MALFCSLVILLMTNLFYMPVQSLNNEGIALWSLKQSIRQDPSRFLKNWSLSDETPCKWKGVECITDRVVSLSLSNKNLTGFLPPIFGNLSALRHIYLRNNNLSGSLPVTLFDLNGLQSLVLSGNSFSGMIPEELGKLGSLQTLDFSGNSFNGSVPPSLLWCGRLKFTGSIPSDMGNLSSLQGTLNLSNNLFSGLIPANLGNLPETVYIDFSHNNLSGPIPQNGALLDAGPTAFVGNPLLCGAPLESMCPPDIPSGRNGQAPRINGTLIMIVVELCFLFINRNYN
ncbi:hypothetical protein EUGRSUZ_J01521 [Eucalyptus grandis]|uniref:Uncharacterized protein n=2 Tax=Eucalyptus grandis TaxID=71139 RepID=A0ACC3J5I9_EUCGR|nr:hypothetical protein EUGRSUZ_J01521 [Eucalyptus grandis]